MRFNVLGSLEVLDHRGDPLDLGGRRQASVLVVLLLEVGRVVPLDRIIDRLWGEDPPISAPGTVQAYVSNLRKILEPDRPPRSPSSLIVSKASGYEIQVVRSAIDATHFEDLLNEARFTADTDPEGTRSLLERALGLWRGPAFADFAYETFAQREISRLDELRASAQELLVDVRLAQGEAAALIPELERLVAEHPFRERFQAQLMVSLYRSGRQADALRSFSAYRRRLGDELGLDPGPELLALEDAILTHDRAIATPVAPASSHTSTTTTTTAPRIVGRRAELAVFERALDRAGEGAGSLLLVEGEAGIGKSHLLSTMMSVAEERGFLAPLGRCMEGGGAPPYWPWIQVVRWLAKSKGAHDITELLGNSSIVSTLLPEAASTAGTGASPVMIADAVISMLRSVCSEQPVVVALDDLYGSDPDSLTLLTMLTDSVGSIPIVVVGTYRTADVADDHPLTELLARVSRLPYVERIPLARLLPDAVATLVEQVNGEPVDDALALEIHRRTGGNALFAVELARLFRAEGTIDGEGGAKIPPGVRDVIRRRLSRLPGDTKTLLGVAAVAGRDFDLDVIGVVAGMDSDQSLDAVDLAIVTELIEETGVASRFRFSHVLVQLALSESLTALRRARLHGQLARALEAAHGTDRGRWSAIAHHAVEAIPATGAAAARPAIWRAAEHAIQSGAPGLAIQLYDQYLGTLEDEPAGPDRDLDELRVQVSLSHAITVGSGWSSDRLLESGRRVTDLALVVGDSTPMLGGLMAQYGHRIVTAQLDDAEAVTATIADLATWASDPMATLCHHLCAGINARYRGRPSEAERDLAEAEAVLEMVDPGATGRVRLPPGQQSALSSYWAHRAQTTWMMGNASAAHHQVDRAIELAQRGEDGFGVSFAAMFALNQAYCSHDVDRAIELHRRHFPECDAGRYPENELLAAVPFSWAQSIRSDDPKTVDATLEAAHAAAAGPLIEGPALWAMAADAAVHHGRSADALEATERAIRICDETGIRNWIAETRRLRAMALAIHGDMSGARAELSHAAALADETGALPIVARLSTTLPMVEA